MVTWLYFTFYGEVDKLIIEWMNYPIHKKLCEPTGKEQPWKSHWWQISIIFMKRLDPKDCATSQMSNPETSE